MEAAVDCSCGEVKTHVVKRARTSDNVGVVLWSHGAVTGAFGALPGVAVVRVRSAVVMRAGWMLIGDACLYDADEIGRFYKACRWAAARGLSIADARKRFAKSATIRPTWDVYHADRDGKPTLRVWRLPRLRWPGLAVWNERGSYEVVSVDREGVAVKTGFRFRTVAALVDHLRKVSV